MKRTIALGVILLSLVVFTASPAVAVQMTDTNDVSTSDCTYDVSAFDENPSTSDCTYDGISVMCSGGGDDDGGGGSC